MPRAPPTGFPINGLFGIIKPSGPTSMDILDKVKALVSNSFLFVPEAELTAQRKRRADGLKGKRNKLKGPKVGQGGTLDPLADGVLVVGVGKGTKQLSKFLDCSKEYQTIGLLGCETDSYDSDGARVKLAPWRHVTKADVEKVLDQFRGNIKQVPPIYSALKMDGKPLYEYARGNIPLPRPIQPRDAQVISLELIDWQESALNRTRSPASSEANKESQALGHRYTWPTKEVDESKKQDFKKLQELILQSEGNSERSEEKITSVKAGSGLVGKDIDLVGETDGVPPIFKLKMVVSSGTYVRSIVHDIGLALGSAAHVVSLTRTRQGEFSLPLDYGQRAQPGQLLPISIQDPGMSPPTVNELPSILHSNVQTETAISATDSTSLSDTIPASNCIPWDIFQKAYDKMKSGQIADISDKPEVWTEWEQKVLECIQAV